MSRQKQKWFPVTPAGTPVTWLGCETEEQAWAALLHDAGHMPYKGKEGFEQRGYTVRQFPAIMATDAPAQYKFSTKFSAGPR